MSLRGYIGDFGDGKTCNMVSDAHSEAYDVRHGVEVQVRAVYSNLTLIDYRVRWNPWYVGVSGCNSFVCFGRWEPVNPDTFGRSWSDGVLRNWRQLLGVHNAIVLVDEIEALFSAQEWGRMPAEVLRRICMQRKNGLDIWWTSPMNSLVNNKIRDMTTHVWHCVKMPKTNLVSMRRIDMRSKNKTISRYRRLGSAMFDLFDSYEIMGDMEGEGYEVGGSDHRLGLRPEQRAVLIRLCRERGEPHPFSSREDGAFGVPRYVYAGGM